MKLFLSQFSLISCYLSVAVLSVSLHHTLFSVCLSVCLSACLSACPSLYLSLSCFKLFCFVRSSNKFKFLCSRFLRAALEGKTSYDRLKGAVTLRETTLSTTTLSIAIKCDTKLNDTRRNNKNATIINKRERDCHLRENE